MDMRAEPSYQIPLAIVVKVAATRRRHVGEGDRLEHSHTTSMMAHVLDIEFVQVLTHADEVGRRKPTQRLPR